VKRFAILAVAMLANPAAAQQVLDTVPATPQPYAAPATAAAAPTLRATHGDWEVHCYGDGTCFMSQLHRRSAGTSDAVFTIAKPGDLTGDNGETYAAFAEIVVPLGVYLPGGLGLKVDQLPAKAAPFERCIDEGCMVRAPVSQTMLANLKGGGVANIVIFAGPDRPVQIPISLAGFTAAYDSF
jgi:invasion protein IalB